MNAEDGELGSALEKGLVAMGVGGDRRRAENRKEGTEGCMRRYGEGEGGTVSYDSTYLGAARMKGLRGKNRVMKHRRA